MANIGIRPAREADFARIKKLIHDSHINPMGLDWPRFVVAETPDGQFAGCGQLKPHGDGTIELASIAVTESMRGTGIARSIIMHLVASTPTRPLYLTCRARLQPFYERFGFKVTPEASLPRYYRRVFKLTGFAQAIHLLPERIITMHLD